jgi:alpha-L-arabinofuranosidase
MNHRQPAIFLSSVLLVFAQAGFVQAQAAAGPAPAIQINMDKVAAQVSPTLYGLMTEEINFSYDGGLYGELIRNRVFKGGDYPRGRRGTPAGAPRENSLAHWSVVRYQGGDAAISVETDQPLSDALPNSLKFDASWLLPGQRAGIANDGYWGIPVRANTTYRASFFARAASPFSGPLSVSIESNDGTIVAAQADVSDLTPDWKQYSATLKTGDVREGADYKFVISAGTPGVVWFNAVSLFPPTYNDRPNGNRVDLMRKLVDMKPAFLRFPGGNYVEGNDKDNYFNWKKTVGPIAQRPTHLSPWNYRSSDGMGLLEFLEWAEDMHAQPVLAVFAGFTLRGTFVATGDELKPFVQDALDEIEYVTGDASTKWGAQRIADGHPDPFPLNYMEIGNEDNLGGGGRTYEERFTAFYDAIKAKYPNLKIIATAAVKGRVPDLLDEHYYMTPVQAEMTAHRYDARPRGAPAVFVGEWATRVGAPTTNLQAALADAAWLTGLERNSDLVQISCYAPLFVNVNPGGMQWPSDLIGYDLMNSYGSPSYYVQKMFNTNIGDVVLDSSAANVPTVPTVINQPGRRGATQPAASRTVNIEQLYYVVTKDTKNGTIYLKVVNISGKPMPVQISLSGTETISPDADGWVLSSASNADTNTIAEPEKIVPQAAAIHDAAAQFTHEFPAYSVSVMLLKTK